MGDFTPFAVLMAVLFALLGAVLSASHLAPICNPLDGQAICKAEIP